MWYVFSDNGGIVEKYGGLSGHAFVIAWCSRYRVRFKVCCFSDGLAFQF